MVVSLVTAIVRVQPSSVLSDRFEPLIAVIVMPPKPEAAAAEAETAEAEPARP